MKSHVRSGTITTVQVCI